jgi:hypothetical protein
VPSDEVHESCVLFVCENEDRVAVYHAIGLIDITPVIITLKDFAKFTLQGFERCFSVRVVINPRLSVGSTLDGFGHRSVFDLSTRHGREH